MGFAVEQVEAALGGLADRAFVALDPTIEWRFARDDRTLEGGKREFDIAAGKSAVESAGGTVSGGANMVVLTIDFRKSTWRRIQSTIQT